MTTEIDNYEKYLVQAIEMCDLAINNNLFIQESKKTKNELEKMLMEYRESKQMKNSFTRQTNT